MVMSRWKCFAVAAQNWNVEVVAWLIVASDSTVMQLKFTPLFCWNVPKKIINYLL